MLQRLNRRLGQKFLVDICYVFRGLHIRHVGWLDLLGLYTVPINPPEEGVGLDLLWTIGPATDSFLRLNQLIRVIDLRP